MERSRELDFQKMYLINNDNYPCEPETVDGISKHVSKKRWVRVKSWEVCVHMWRLPVSNLDEKLKSSVSNSKNSNE